MESIFNPIQCTGDLKDSKMQGCKLFSHPFFITPQDLSSTAGRAQVCSGHILCSRAIVAFHLIKRKYLKP